MLSGQDTTSVVLRSNGATPLVVGRASGLSRMLRHVETMGERLRRARLARGVKHQSELGRLVAPHLGRELDQQTISAIERRKSVRTSFLYAFASALRVDPEWLLTGRGESGLEAKSLPPAYHNHQKNRIDHDKALQEIIDTWHTVSPDGRKLMMAAARAAKGDYSDSRPANTGGNDTAARLPHASDADAGKSQAIHASTRQRRKRK